MAAKTRNWLRSSLSSSSRRSPPHHHHNHYHYQLHSRPTLDYIHGSVCTRALVVDGVEMAPSWTEVPTRRRQLLATELSCIRRQYCPFAHRAHEQLPDHTHARTHPIAVCIYRTTQVESGSVSAVCVCACAAVEVVIITTRQCQWFSLTTRMETNYDILDAAAAEISRITRHQSLMHHAHGHSSTAQHVRSVDYWENEREREEERDGEVCKSRLRFIAFISEYHYPYINNGRSLIYTRMFIWYNLAKLNCQDQTDVCSAY